MSRRPVNFNLAYRNNPGFETVPSFTAASDTAGRWIDGTAAGHATDNRYGWATFSEVGTGAAQFDTSVFHRGLASLKVSSLVAGSSFACMNSTSATALLLRQNGIAVLPNTSYTCKYWMKTMVTSGDASDGANINFQERTGTGSAGTGNPGTLVKTTTDWTEYTVVFTTGATTRFVTPKPQIVGNTGAASLLMDAWFDDIEIKPTIPLARLTVT